MSSYTDNPQLTQFTPYTPQLPLEAMISVGAERQQMYNQGVQKIQSELNNVAGLDVMRDVDKNYLQSKLNELGNRLTTVAAGDFSNFQLVNSVSGMTNQLIKDKNVQNAVQSTAHIRKQQSLAAQAKKDGKSSPENEYHLANQINQYASSTNLEDTFNGEYVPYTDVDKKLRDIADKMHEIDNSVDAPYQRDARGEYILDKNGKPTIDMAMWRTKIKGKPAEKILANFLSSLDENDQRQLRITSDYHYRGATQNTFINDLTQNYNSSVDLLKQKVTNLNLELVTNKNLTQAERAEKQAEINASVKSLTDGVLESKLKNDISQITNSQNLNEYKYRLYTQKHLTTLAQNMSYESKQQELLNNPYFQAQMSTKELQQKYDKMRQDENHFQLNYQQEERKFDWQKTKDAIELENKRKGAGSVGPFIAERISTETNKPTINNLSGEIDGILGTKDANGNIIDPGAIGKLTADNIVNVPKGEKDPKAFLNKLYDHYQTDPSFITTQTSPAIREYLRQRQSLDILATQKINLLNSAKKIGADDEAIIDAELNKEAVMPGLVSAKDLIQVQNEWKKAIFSGSGSTGGAYGGGVNIDYFLSKFTKGSKLYNLATTFVKNYNRQPLTTTQQYLIKKTGELELKYGKKLEQSFNNIEEKTSKYLADRMPERQAKSTILDSKNATDMLAVKAVLGKALSDYNTGGVDVYRSSDFDPDKAQALKDKEGTEIKLVQLYGGRGEIHLMNGKEIQKIPIAETSIYFPQYEQRGPLNNIKGMVMSSPNKTTSISGNRQGDDPVNAGLTGYNIPELARTSIAPLVKMDVVGDDNNIGGESDKYYVYLYVNKEGNWKKTLLTPDYVNDAGLQKVINTINPNTVNEILKK